MQFFSLFLFLCLTFSLSARIPDSNKTKCPHFFLITIPKSGTHLITKLLTYIQTRGEKNLSKHLGFPLFNHFGYPEDMRALDAKVESGVDAATYYIGHTDLTKPVLNFLSKHPDWPVILGIRDLRDIFVSELYFQWRDMELVIGPSSMETKLDFLLTNDEWNLPFPVFLFQYYAESMLQLMKHPATLVVRFEDLVGSRGGGNDEKQRENILKIAKRLKVSLPENRLNFLKASLFGDTTTTSYTFRSGQIGQWKTHFTRGQLDFFNQKFGHLQQALGYSID